MLKKIPKDTIVLFSSGEYSDYSITGLMQALTDLDSDVIRNDYINLYPEESAKYSLKESNFINYLKEKNYFKEVESPAWMEWYMGAYSSIEHMAVHDGPLMFN